MGRRRACPDAGRVALVGLVSLFIGACASGPALPAQVLEPSGATASPGDDDVIWVHGDSGTDAAVFAIRVTDASVLARVEIEGVANVDWEDIATERGDPTGDPHERAHALWVADIGNNGQARTDLAVHRIREPDPRRPGRVSVDRTIAFRYPDQDDLPNWDAESLFVHDDRLWLLTKHRADTSTTLYRFPALNELDELDQPDEDAVVLERVAEFDLGGSRFRFGGRASGATTSPDGRHLAVLSYHALFVFDLAAEHPLASLVHRIELDTVRLQQCEAIAWTDAGVIIINESRAVFRVGDPLDPRRTRFPEPQTP